MNKLGKFREFGKIGAVLRPRWGRRKYIQEAIVKPRES
jgi:hypothetical protein